MSLSKTPLYRELSSLISARLNCQKAGNSEWHDKHKESILKLVKDYMPSGSGIDCGTTLDLDASTPEKLVFHFSFHHMDEYGGYCGWTEHTLTVRPSLQFGIDIRISGRDRGGIKEVLYEQYHYALTQTVWQSEDCEWHSSLYEKETA